MVHKRERQTILALVLPAFIIVFFIAIYPMIYSLVVSFQDFSIVDPAGARFIGAENFIELLNDYRLIGASVNTLIFTVIVVSAEFLFGMVLAFAFNRQFRGDVIFRSALLMPMMTTSVCVGLMWRLIFNQNAGVANYFRHCRERTETQYTVRSEPS